MSFEAFFLYTGIITPMTDEELVKNALNHDMSAVEKLYDRYIEPMYRFCWYQLHDEQVAQDLTQDIFVEMIHSLKSFSFSGSFKNWLYTIAKRLVCHHLREKYQLPKTTLGDWIPDEDNSDWIDPDEERQQGVKRATVDALLSVLKPAEQEAITLVYLQNYSSKEAGVVTGRTPESIRVLVHRALKKLQKKV